MKKLSVLLLIVLLLVLTVNVLADDVTTKLNEDYGLTEEKLKQAELSTNKAKTKLYDELEEISKLEDKFMKPGEFAENLIEIDILTKDNLSNLDLAYKELLKSENKRLRKDFIEAPSWVKSKIKEILNEGESSKESTEWSDEELSALDEAVEQSDKKLQQEKKETQQEKKETQQEKKETQQEKKETQRLKQRLEMLKEIEEQLEQENEELAEENEELAEENEQLEEKLKSVNNKLRNKIERFIEKIENSKKVNQKYVDWAIETLNEAKGLYDNETKSEYLDILKSY